MVALNWQLEEHISILIHLLVLKYQQQEQFLLINP